jgi:site-specific recombinase XerD
MSAGVTRSLGLDTSMQEPSARHSRASVARLIERFPPRPRSPSWPTTVLPRGQMEHLVSSSPLLGGLDERTRLARLRGLGTVIDWLEAMPGDNWQQRWDASGADDPTPLDWRRIVAGDAGGPGRSEDYLGSALALLVSSDVLRPSVTFLLTSSTPRRLAASLAATRDPDGFAQLGAALEAAAVSTGTSGPATSRIAAIVAAKGGRINDITVGDCLELLSIAKTLFTDGHYNSPFFYQLLYSIGIFGDEAPVSIRVFNTAGKRSAGDLVDRYNIECRPVRDLLVDYLREREMRLDHSTLRSLSATLANVFWRDLEVHHPGIASLHLSTEAKAGWKQRLAEQPACTGSVRLSAMEILSTVRSFYLDIAEWAYDDPARWGPWAAPNPVRYAEISHKKNRDQRKSRMDQRTRERLAVLPVLARSTETQRRDSAERLDMARSTEPGEPFHAGGQTLVRSSHGGRSVTHVWAEDAETATHRDLTLEEHRAFWAWAAIEVLRHTGVRVEELGALSHHDMIEYRLPDGGEVIPLLHVAPSKTDVERLLVISPELADVLSAIICRVRGEDKTVPLVVAHDEHECTWLPPMPLLFQRRFSAEHRPIAPQAIRLLLVGAGERAGIVGRDAKPLRFSPHDFRRMFITDAILHGMPPHIAQLVAGHQDLNVTMGYKAVYPEEVINGHRAFIARRRALRPSEEYRVPTDEEWEEFLGHFERRKLSLGTCGRSYATPCIHEHSCIRCPLLRPDPLQRPRLVEIEANLGSRIDEATREGWHGEAEGLQVSLAAARQKLAHMDEIAARRTEVHLGSTRPVRTAARTVGVPEIPEND